MITLKSYFGKVQKELDKSERKVRTKAARHVTKVLKSKAKTRYGKDSNYYKGIGYKNYKDVTKVGVGPPAFHAHLIEFGTDPRYTTAGKSTGKMPEAPLIIPTFEAEKEAVANILITEWS